MRRSPWVSGRPFRRLQKHGCRHDRGVGGLGPRPGPHWHRNRRPMPGPLKCHDNDDGPIITATGSSDTLALPQSVAGFRCPVPRCVSAVDAEIRDARAAVDTDFFRACAAGFPPLSTEFARRQRAERFQTPCSKRPPPNGARAVFAMFSCSGRDVSAFTAKCPGDGTSADGRSSEFHVEATIV